VSGQLSEVEARIETVHKLSAVIAAMRGIAASRVQEAKRHLDAIRMYAATIGDAISETMVFTAGASMARSSVGQGGEVSIVLCAEQGFAGAFSARVLEAARSETAASDRPAELLLVGDRGVLIAREFGIAADWSAPMIAHTARTAHLAGQIIEAMYERITAGRATRVSVIHANPGGPEGYEVVVKRLVPFDYARFPPPRTDVRPLLTLPPQDLLTRLVEEYVFAEISEAIMLSFAAENEARMRAMIAAHDNVRRTRDDLVGRARRLRQDSITEEIMELAAGSHPRR
jgi:F-type H+-transporting ATPase subunit gamma